MAAFNESKPTGGWKNLDWLILPRRVRTPATTPPESEHESVASVPEPSPIVPVSPQSKLATFGITIATGRGIITVYREDHEPRTFRCSNTGAVIDDMRKRAEAEQSADEAYDRCMKFVAAYM